MDNRVICADSREFLPTMYKDSVSLVVTSPPYYRAGKGYDEHSSSLEEYLRLLVDVFGLCVPLLRDGGRITVNIAAVHRKPYVPIHAYLHHILHSLDLRCLGEILWYKGKALGCTTAWGSWCRPSAPTLRDVHEYILVYQKGKKLPDVEKAEGETIGKEDFIQSTRSVWEIAPSRSKTHPAIFPSEVPRRLILLYSWPNDLVLDPFCGIGTTCKQAKALGRRYVGVDVSPDYVREAEANIQQGGE